MICRAPCTPVRRVYLNITLLSAFPREPVTGCALPSRLLPARPRSSRLVPAPPGSSPRRAAGYKAERLVIWCICCLGPLPAGRVLHSSACPVTMCFGYAPRDRVLDDAKAAAEGLCATRIYNVLVE